MWGCRANMCLGAQSMHFSFFHLGCQFFHGYFANMGVLQDWERWLGHWNRALKVKPIHGNGHGPGYTQTKCSRNKLSKILPRKQLFPLLISSKECWAQVKRYFCFPHKAFSDMAGIGKPYPLFTLMTHGKYHPNGHYMSAGQGRRKLGRRLAGWAISRARRTLDKRRLVRIVSRSIEMTRQNRRLNASNLLSLLAMPRTSPSASKDCAIRDAMSSSSFFFAGGLGGENGIFYRVGSAERCDEGLWEFDAKFLWRSFSLVCISFQSCLEGKSIVLGQMHRRLTCERWKNN